MGGTVAEEIAERRDRLRAEISAARREDNKGFLLRLENALERALIYMGNPDPKRGRCTRNDIILDVSHALRDCRAALAPWRTFPAESGANSPIEESATNLARDEP